LCLGEKITIGEYTEEEIDFIKSICDIFAIVYKKLSKIEQIEKENIKLKRHEEQIESLEKSDHRLKGAHTNQQFEENIYQEMHSFEIDNYAFFSYENITGKFKAKYVDKNDSYELQKSSHEINSSTVLENFLNSAESMTFLDSALLPDFFAKNFTKKILSKSGLIAICPYVVGDIPLGFLLILNANKEALDDKKHLVVSFVKSVFSYLEGQKNYSQVSGAFVDNLQIMYQRINKEINNTRGLKIPLTIALLSIKNYKRYLSQVEIGSGQKLMSDFGALIINRLDDSDFCYRYDRNKLLIVMPGKNKKYALPLINTVRNELSDIYNSESLQLLITYLLAEYPKDGKGLNELLDCID
jgi:GGDEF domain-containing protein